MAIISVSLSLKRLEVKPRLAVIFVSSMPRLKKTASCLQICLILPGTDFIFPEHHEYERNSHSRIHFSSLDPVELEHFHGIDG